MRFLHSTLTTAIILPAMTVTGVSADVRPAVDLPRGGSPERTFDPDTRVFTSTATPALRLRIPAAFRDPGRLEFPIQGKAWIAYDRLSEAVTRGSLSALRFLDAPAADGSAEPPGPAADLVGTWAARRDFGPEVRGDLTITRGQGGSWRAEIAGHSAGASVRGGVITFELPGGRGSFRGRLAPDEGWIRGHWIQPATYNSGRQFASPVVLHPVDQGRWRGEVVPLEDDFTFYLVARSRDDGSVGAFLRNPDRNFGLFLNADRLEREGDAVRLIGRFFRSTEERVLAQGTYSPDLDRLSLMLRGASYDFERVDDDPATHFYARGKAAERYRYRPPLAEGDGWAVGTLEEAGIALGPIREMIATIVSAPVESVHGLYVHAILIARHGKLVLEEYFHGYHRGKTHDTRSASKSLTSTLVGAAIEAGAPLALSSPVYETIHGDDPAADVDPRKRRMTVEHLLTMTSGFECDDRDPTSRGNEDVMQQQTEEPDWYRYTLDLPMVREPGELAVYCSASPNLLGGVLTAATGEPLPELFHRLIAEPLGVERYHLILQPTGEPYMGGGIYWLPRDFMKLGQIMLDDGLWNGRRVLSGGWVARATAPLYELRQRHYGYLWWVQDFPYKDGSVGVFYAGGNGGQVVIGIPELDLLVTFFAGNYSDPVMARIQNELVPRYILPAVD